MHHHHISTVPFNNTMKLSLCCAALFVLLSLNERVSGQSSDDVFSVVFHAFQAGPENPREGDEIAQLESNLNVYLYPNTYGIRTVCTIVCLNYTVNCDAHESCVPSLIGYFSGVNASQEFLLLSTGVGNDASAAAYALGLAAVAVGPSLYGTRGPASGDSSNPWLVPVIVSSIVLVGGGIGMWVFARWFVRRVKEPETAPQPVATHGGLEDPFAGNLEGFKA